MRNVIAIPLLGLAVVVQTAIVGQLSLLNGVADVTLVMLAACALQERVTTAFHWAFLAALMVSLVSRLPWFVYFPAYVGTVFLALVLQRRIWQVPMLAMFSVTFLGTLLLHSMSLALSQPVRGHIFTPGCPGPDDASQRAAESADRHPDFRA